MAGELRLEMQLTLLICCPKNREIFLDYPGETEAITRVMKRKAEKKVGRTHCEKDPTAVAGFEDEGRGCEQRTVSGLGKLDKAQKQGLSWNPQEEGSPVCGTVGFVTYRTVRRHFGAVIICCSGHRRLSGKRTWKGLHMLGR